MSTIKEVAKHAGVSPATASLALNNKNVAEKTRLKVLESARALNYVPNRIGKTLITGKSDTIELLIMHSKRYSNIPKETSLFYYIIQGILLVADRFKYSLRFDLCNIEERRLQEYFSHKVNDRSLDGIIIIPQFLESYEFVEIIEASKLPYVLLSPRTQRIKNINYVDMGNYKGGQIAAKRLLGSGLRNIAFINGPKEHIDAIERERGFFKVLSSNNITLDEKDIYYGEFTISSGYIGMKYILKHKKPEAVFCANDYMAAGAMKYIYEQGLRVPQDTSVIGYDNSDIAPALVPSLTTVDNHFELLGERLAMTLIQLIDRTISTIESKVEPKLIERDSIRQIDNRAPIVDKQSRYI